MDDVACNGSEPAVTSCRHITSHNCVHGEDAGVQCPPSEFDLFYTPDYIQREILPYYDCSVLYTEQVLLLVIHQIVAD